MRKKVLHCAMIGLGRIAWDFHLPGIRRNSGFELTAVVDPDEKRLTEAAHTFGAEILCRTLQDLPAEQVDLAVIASPTSCHCAQSLWLMEHGVDVLCDKPVACCYSDALKMKEVMRRTGRKMMAYQPYRLCFDTLTARAILDSDKLGNIFMIRRVCHNFSRRNDWQSLRAEGGGMLLNYGAHYIDQMFYLMHDTCADAVCRTCRVLSLGDAEDVVEAQITGHSGCLYSLDINQAAADHPAVLALYGDLGSAFMRDDGDWDLCFCHREELPPIELHAGLSAPGRRYPSEKLPWIHETHPRIPEDLGEYYRRCFQYFALEEAPLVPFEETLEVMRAIELCRQSSSRIISRTMNLKTR